YDGVLSLVITHKSLFGIMQRTFRELFKIRLLAKIFCRASYRNFFGRNLLICIGVNSFSRTETNAKADSLIPHQVLFR
ncbi:MAG: hypothetical protein ACI80M_001440, partial [Gammaproteobacteria bacterium]